MKWVGKADGVDIKGTLRVPEVSHEAIDGLSDYVVGVTNLSHSSHSSLISFSFLTLFVMQGLISAAIRPVRIQARRTLVPRRLPPPIPPLRPSPAPQKTVHRFSPRPPRSARHARRGRPSPRCWRFHPARLHVKPTLGTGSQEGE